MGRKLKTDKNQIKYLYIGCMIPRRKDIGIV